MFKMINAFHFAKGELPFRYLGVPLSTKKLSVIQCQPLIRKILQRIDAWSTKFLSYAGRVQLIKSVLFGVQSYWCQVFLLPQKVLKMIQAACITFLWTGKSGTSRRALVAWETVCLPKAAGGWNLMCIHLWNKAAICKLLWNLAQKKDKVWVKWVNEFDIKGKDLTAMSVPNHLGGEEDFWVYGVFE